MALLEARGVTFSYHSATKKIPPKTILRDVDLTIRANEFFCMLGPSGCGKSTLLKIFAGFEKCTSGCVLDNGEPITDVSHERAMVFQEDAVFPWMNVYANVEYGLKVRKVAQETRQRQAEKFIDLVSLKGYEKMLPKELSGGMKKRVDLARVLANDPRILLMDEPFGALDAMTKEKLQEQLVQIWESSRKTIVFVTHDIEEALFLGDRIVIIQPIDNGGEVKLFDVPFKRPRDLRLKEEPDFQKMRRMLTDELKKYETLSQGV